MCGDEDADEMVSEFLLLERKFGTFHVDRWLAWERRKKKPQGSLPAWGDGFHSKAFPISSVHKIMLDLHIQLRDVDVDEANMRSVLNSIHEDEVI